MPMWLKLCFVGIHVAKNIYKIKYLTFKRPYKHFNNNRCVLPWVIQGRQGGGLIRDSYGRWIKGYMRYIGITTSIIAEFWALRDGLTLASQLGITHLAVELDAKVVVDLILSRKIPNSLYTSLLSDCRYLLGQLGSFSGPWSSMCLGRLIEEQTTLLKEPVP